MIYLLDGCLILMHEIRVLDLGLGFLALWIIDPYIKWVKSFEYLTMRPTYFQQLLGRVKDVRDVNQSVPKKVFL